MAGRFPSHVLHLITFSKQLESAQEILTMKNMECEKLVQTHHNAIRARDAAKVELEEVGEMFFPSRFLVFARIFSVPRIPIPSRFFLLFPCRAQAKNRHGFILFKSLLVPQA